MEKGTLEIYVYIHVKDSRVIYCGKGRKTRCVDGRIYDRAYNNKDRKYNVTTVEVFKVKYFDNEQDAFKYEAFLTSWYKKCGQCEYNINIANHHSEEIRQKMSETRIKNGTSKGENNPMYGKGYKIAGEKHPMYGRHHSEETRQKISKNHADMSGDKSSMYGKTGAEHPRSKVVVAYTDSGSYYKEFAGMHDAERELGIYQSNICKCCKGEYKSAGKITVNGKKEKLRWKYKE